jgi:hypothetical protein
LGVTQGAAQVAMEEMTPEDLFHTLLGLGTQWRVMRCEFAAEEGIVRLWIEETPYLWNGESITMKEAVTAYDHTLLAAAALGHVVFFDQRFFAVAIRRGRRMWSVAIRRGRRMWSVVMITEKLRKTAFRECWSEQTLEHGSQIADGIWRSRLLGPT